MVFYDELRDLYMDRPFIPVGGYGIDYLYLNILQLFPKPIGNRCNKNML